MQIYIPPGPRLGEVVIEAKDISKSYGDKLLFENLNFSIPRGAVVGIIGPNGAGKSTLFRLITGQEQPDSGSFKVGETVKLGYLDQQRSAVASDKTVFQEISGGEDVIKLGAREVNARAYASWYAFTGDSQQKRVKDLSGGEKNRLYMAKMLKEGANVLLLDEPTNDLDVNTMRALEEAILEFGGNVLCISHDRWFLDRICTHIMAFEGDSHVEFFTGNYSEYEADLKRRLGVDTLVPKRIQYRKLQH